MGLYLHYTEVADFFSFGTNDLTQMTFGFSRDDAGKFLKVYQEKGILKNDPFQILDQEGVGQLVKMGTEKGRSTKSHLKVGICGEHGGEPSSVKFCASKTLFPSKAAFACSKLAVRSISLALFVALICLSRS